jgi:hypothetical protein
MILVIGGEYSWIGQPQRLVYKGKDGSWHQFTEVGIPDVVWCDVLDSDLYMLEETDVNNA